jgi:agmatinase
MDRERVRRVWGRADDMAAAPPQVWLRPDVPTFAHVPAARRPEELNGASAAVLGIPWQPVSAAAAPGLAGGPAAIRRASAAYAAALHGGTLPEVDRELVPSARLRVVDYGDVDIGGGDTGAMTAAAHQRLIEVVAAGAVPLVLGGDAGVATPALEVLCGRLTGKLGIIAFTAGLGVCGPEGDAGACRWRRAFELGVVEPEAFVQIGVRAAASAAETAAAAALGHRWYTVADVDEAGVEVVAQEALEAATRGTEAVYLSIDVDVLDLPGARSSEPGGLSLRELLRALRVAARAPLGAADVSGVPGEGAPATASGAARAVLEVIAGLAQQFPEGQGAGAVAP